MKDKNMATPRQFALDFSAKRPPAVQAKIAEGMAVAEDHANSRWKAIIAGCILAVARRLPELCADDVYEELEKIPNAPSTHNLAALGPLMLRASRDKIITATDRVTRSKRPEKHGNLSRIWRSNYFKEGAQ